MTKKTKSAVVTGVSSGIGRAISATLIENGWHVFGSVRKSEDAKSASDAFGASFTPLIFDVADEASVLAAADVVKTMLAGETLDGLVNNAGMPSAGPMQYIPIEELQRVFDVNTFGVVRCCQAFIPLLGAGPENSEEPGKIINISSSSGKISVPFMGPYSMSKFAVEALSDALRVELKIHGIDVTVVGPGPVKTPIFAKTEAIDLSRYEGTEYANALQRVKSASKLADSGLAPEEIGRLVLKIFNDPSPKARYAAMNNKFMRWTLPRILPKRLLDRALARRMGLTRQS